ncbi:MAG: thioesterase family protein [Alphaproteobacteria bacterium]|nr:thioesterase family protein [Alphaproteobacteria bacterium]
MPKYFETYRAAVNPWQCDQLGHMNVQHHMAAVSDAAFQMFIHLGLGPEVERDPPIALAAVRMEFDFPIELNVGDAYRVESTIHRVGTKSVTFHHRMKKVATGEVVMEANVVGVCLNLESREGMALPEDVAARAREIMESP